MFTYEMPTKVYVGKDCIIDGGAAMKALGQKAFIVTGRHSAKANGSQAAMTAALEQMGITWVLYDQVESNPSIETVRLAAAMAKAAEADFVIGIGGGSPMDAAKAIALICTNDVDDTQLFTGPYHQPLPIVCVPTTAGTGSEVTKVAVLTNPHVGTKKSINNPCIFPALAYVDPTFTLSVNQTVTIDTAIDALSHAVEGYMSKRATPISDAWAKEAMRFIGPHLDELSGNLSYAAREDLLYASTLAGIVIAQTGTTLVHGMGYQLTYYKGISHGRANGLLFPQYMELMEETQPDKVDKVWNLLGLADARDFAALIADLMPDKVKLTESEIKTYVALTMPTNAVKTTAYDVTEQVIADMYRRLSIKLGRPSEGYCQH